MTASGAAHAALLRQGDVISTAVVIALPCSISPPLPPRTA
jgi:hypothetical protein